MPKPITPLRGIIFDLGWTLVDFDGDVETMQARRSADLAAFLAAQGFKVDGDALYASYQEEMVALWHAGGTLSYEYPASLAMLRALRRYLNRSQAAALTADTLAASFASVVPRWELYPDTLDTLASLHDADYRLGAISNTNYGKHVHQVVDRCGLRRWLSPILMSDEVGLRKPHPRIFWMVLDEWNLPPEQVLMVGDTLNADVLGAQNVGMRAVWIDRGLTNPWSQNEASRTYIIPDATVEQLAELPGLLASEFA